MDHRERFIRTIERKPVDRPATWIGEPVSAAIPALLKHFGAASFNDLKRKIDDDVYHVNIPVPIPDQQPYRCGLQIRQTPRGRQQLRGNGP